MKREEKIANLAEVFVAAGMTPGMAAFLSKCKLDELFPPLPPIERDEEYDREYIPMPGGYEVQTKGKGSTFRIANKTGRMAFGPTSFEQDFLTEMAYKIRKSYGE